MTMPKCDTPHQLRPQRRLPALKYLTCAHCSKIYGSFRADSTTCGSRCRQQLHRSKRQ